jgi:hypothetical protein
VLPRHAQSRVGDRQADRTRRYAIANPIGLPAPAIGQISQAIVPGTEDTEPRTVRFYFREMHPDHAKLTMFIDRDQEETDK